MKTKKELKQAYKQSKPISGVFQVMNTVNKMILIEGATNMTSKWNRHRTELRFGSHRNRKLQEDWNHYGESSFVFSVVSELDSEEDDSFDPRKEVKLLYEMVVEEKQLEDNMKY